MSVLRTGRGRAGGGGGGQVEFLTDFFFAKKCSWGLKTQKKKNIYIWGGGRQISVFFPY